MMNKNRGGSYLDPSNSTEHTQSKFPTKVLIQINDLFEQQDLWTICQ